MTKMPVISPATAASCSPADTQTEDRGREPQWETGTQSPQSDTKSGGRVAGPVQRRSIGLRNPLSARPVLQCKCSNEESQSPGVFSVDSDIKVPLRPWPTNNLDRAGAAGKLESDEE